MMDCAAYRRVLMADPQAADVELAEHRSSCDDCRAFTDRLLKFEARLERALRVPLPAGAERPPAQVVPLRRPGRRTGWFAMAASVLVAVVVAGALWLGASGSSLAADVVNHMGGEPQAWRLTNVPVPAAQLTGVLRDAHMSLAPGAGVVSYASSCAFRGHQVPHLVLQAPSGPVTVMVLVHEHVAGSKSFDEQGYRGVILPVAGHGSLAVLTRGQEPDSAAVRRIARRVLDSIVWNNG
jgi:hypothetical protein